VFAQADLLNFNPAFLLFCNKHITQFFSLLNCVEVVNDHTNKQVNDELASNNHEGNEEDDDGDISILLWLKANTTAINTAIHNLNPSFTSCHLEKRVHSIKDIVEVIVFINPFASLR